LNKNIIWLFLIALLAVAFTSYPRVIEDEETPNATNLQELDEKNLSILKEAGNCFGVDLTANISCRKYNFNGDKTVDILDLTAFTNNESLRAGINMSK
jgi:hypothetical protein